MKYSKNWWVFVKCKSLVLIMMVLAETTTIVCIELIYMHKFHNLS